MRFYLDNIIFFLTDSFLENKHNILPDMVLHDLQKTRKP